MAKQRSIFVDGAKARGVEEQRASYIFDLMEKFAGYGFNKSHSAAYALIANQTAWLKAHYPAQFMAAVMSADMDNTDKLVVIKDDCSGMNLIVDSPDVNRSAYEFTVDSAGRIIYGLGAIKGIGQGVVDAIISNRQANGPFRSLGEFCQRIDHQKLNQRILETLIRAGALDPLGANRASLMHASPAIMKRAEQSARALAAGQSDLFGGSEKTLSAAEDEVPVIREWSERDRLKGERESLGLYLTGHPFEQYREHSRHFTNGSIASVVSQSPGNGARAQWQRRNVVLAGLVIDLRRRGNRVTLMLDDNTERVEVTLFEEAARQYRHLLTKDEVLVVEGGLRFDDFINGWRVAAKSLQSVDEAIEEHARRLVIRWSEGALNGEFVRGLREALQPFAHGPCDVCIEYVGPSATAVVTLGDQWAVKPTRELRDRLSQFLGEEAYALHYPRVPVNS
jgi:DNA polymerase-3 subunit alpha